MIEAMVLCFGYPGLDPCWCMHLELKSPLAPESRGTLEEQSQRQLSHSFRGVVTHATLALVADA